MNISEYKEKINVDIRNFKEKLKNKLEKFKEKQKEKLKKFKNNNKNKKNKKKNKGGKVEDEDFIKLCEFIEARIIFEKQYSNIGGEKFTYMKEKISVNDNTPEIIIYENYLMLFYFAFLNDNELITKIVNEEYKIPSLQHFAKLHINKDIYGDLSREEYKEVLTKVLEKIKKYKETYEDKKNYILKINGSEKLYLFLEYCIATVIQNIKINRIYLLDQQRLLLKEFMMTKLGYYLFDIHDKYKIIFRTILETYTNRFINLEISEFINEINIDKLLKLLELDINKPLKRVKIIQEKSLKDLVSEYIKLLRRDSSRQCTKEDINDVFILQPDNGDNITSDNIPQDRIFSLSNFCFDIDFLLEAIKAQITNTIINEDVYVERILLPVNPFTNRALTIDELKEILQFINLKNIKLDRILRIFFHNIDTLSTNYSITEIRNLFERNRLEFNYRTGNWN